MIDRSSHPDRFPFRGGSISLYGSLEIFIQALSHTHNSRIALRNPLETSVPGISR
jgi:hypothetical protein